MEKMMYDSIFEIEKKKKAHPALYSDGKIIVSYGDLAEQISCMANMIARRTLVFCMCRNEPGAVVGYVSFVENAIVPLLLDADLREEQLRQFVSVYRPAYIWAPADWADTHSEYVTEQVCELYSYSLWKTGYESYPLHEQLGLLLATSGSTGDPKLVRISRTNLCANTKSICEYLHLDEAERPITTLPMQYTYGLSILNSHLLAGACILMTTYSYVQMEFWRFLDEQRATSFGGVPYTYEILKKMHLFDKEIPSLRSITQAGGKLSVPLQQEVAQWAAARGIRFYIMYGQTEATARMGYLPPEQVLHKPGSIGIAIPGGQFSLIDDDGNEIVDADRVGELVYKGLNVSMGYASKQEDLQLGDERHGVLYTGDMAKCDAEGYYYIVGRRSRFIKLFGVRVSLDACETMLREKYPNLDIACSGADDHMKVYIAWKQEQRATESNGFRSENNRQEFEETVCDSVIRDLSSDLNLYHKAFECIFVGKIPKNTAGKILYFHLAQA